MKELKLYDVMVADLPWKYDNQQQNDPKRGGITYPTMSMQALYDLPMYKCMKPNSIMFFWVTLPKLVDSFYENPNPLSIIHAWGFRPVTAAFVWVKLNRRAIINLGMLDVAYDLYSGLGRYTNSNIELCLVCRRGKGIPRVAKNVKQLIFAPIGEHSAKPQEQYNRIYDLYGDVEYLEIFARKQNPPPAYYTATGLDYDGLDIREWIKQYD